MADLGPADTWETPFGLRSREVRPGVVLVEITGELDYLTEPHARAYLARCTVSGPQHLVVDLAGVTFMPSQGLQLLIAAHLHHDSIQGELHLLGVKGNRPVELVLDLSGVTGELDIHPDLTALLCSIDAR